MRCRPAVFPTLDLIMSREHKLEVEDPPIRYDYHRHSVEEVSLLSPWRIHTNIGYKQEGLPSTPFQSFLALPPHPTAPPERHEKIKEEGPYPLERDEVKI
ncbi:hypothetical protein O181_120450 [Austropuccinia psidii MF-1]|uniref:Uncharacterized protein n=1 Tax=Austropuccinia psidii MF-1 TaxID=1389203 RepID=A0A9Q3KK69_9BASI|nr:hypothetical protein [Austropuccinia psidii MF-1]